MIKDRCRPAAGYVLVAQLVVVEVRFVDLQLLHHLVREILLALVRIERREIAQRRCERRRERVARLRHVDGAVEVTGHGACDATQRVELIAIRRRSGDLARKHCVLHAFGGFSKMALGDAETGPSDRVGRVKLDAALGQLVGCHIGPAHDRMHMSAQGGDIRIVRLELERTVNEIEGFVFDLLTIDELSLRKQECAQETTPGQIHAARIDVESTGKKPIGRFKVDGAELEQMQHAGMTQRGGDHVFRLPGVVLREPVDRNIDHEIDAGQRPRIVDVPYFLAR